MIDTHCHLYTEEFADDWQDAMNRAQAAGVTKILLPNINMQSLQPMLHLVSLHPGYFYPMLGLHPEDVTEHWSDDLSAMEHELQQEKHPFVAIGEVGLDLYWDTTFRNEQIAALQQQVEWALRYNLPLMIHCRNAHRKLVDVLSPFKEQLTGVFHCFGGRNEEAAELLQFPHFALGIGGVVTFKKSTLPDVLRSTVPLSRIVLETDSPYLAPVPYRGKRNESSYLTEVVGKLAEIYTTNDEEIVRVTSENALNIFPKAK